ncbi:lipoyl(octanoyl) transferase LipB [Stackebrandtia nassauensis]|uniref:Octanoyltransferase n=1 Tax=Stackebrandtia nassauensis (strain DSM 44728 / CIP 108903 / NRRL B-16338 / NBRC 102104 / LLR-40K-21) TaxID=446470 RepID=D3Q8T7_STANL|nr:lipoyl(octanoyl) transferase LipB [Stackebrandtia nassauensis]ADD44529.1 lipoate-protein ligase B [Stackebrandtia nassauensis DSM 44728]
MSDTRARTLKIDRLGTVDYARAWDLQKDLQDKRINDEIDDTVLLLEHPSVYTAGRRTEKWTYPDDGTPVVEVDRGGQITWHGPGQLVGYPIVKLTKPIDVVKYVRRVEDMLMAVCGEFGVATTRIDDRTGVWIPADDRGPERKIASIGVRVRWAVTLHGFALNCDNDMSFFDHIVPCAIMDKDMTSLSRETGRDVTVDEVIPVTEKHMHLILD